MNQDITFKSKLDEELVHGSYSKFYILILADILAVICFYLLLCNQVNNHIAFILWVIAMVILNHLARGIFWWKYYNDKKNNKPINLVFWKYYFIFNSTQSGILWALGGMMFAYVNEPVYRILIFVYLTGVLGAPMPMLVTYIFAYLGYTIPICLVMLMLSVSIIPSLSIILWCITLLYVGLIFFSATYLHNLLIESIRLKLYNLNILTNLKRSEDTFKNTIENAPIGMAIVSPEGKYMSVNTTMYQTLGYSNEELCNMTMMDVTYPEDIKQTINIMNKILHGEMQIAHLEKRFVRKDKTIIWAMISLSLIRDEKGKPINFICQMVDLSERIENEKRMLDLNRKTLETLNELKLIEHDENLLNKLNRILQICISQEEAFPRIGLIVQDLFPGLSGGLSVFNKAENKMETILQWGKDQLLQKVFLPTDCFAIREGTINSVEDPKKAIPCTHYFSPPQGAYMALPLIVQNELIGVIHLLAQPGNIIPQHKQDIANTFGNIVKLALANINLRHRLHELSLHDPLTNLFNRRYLTEFLSRELLRISREKSTLCFSMIDIDDFKKFNDRFGHDTGDKVLQFIAALLSTTFRGSDSAFRYGGEEFAVIMPGIGYKDAIRRMDEFREKIKREALIYNNHPLPHITVSIGIAIAPQNGKNIDDLQRAADQALYLAKQEGKDRVEVYHLKNLE